MVLFITSNVSDKPSIAVSRFVGRLALGQEAPLPPKVITLTNDELHKFEGTYNGVKVTATSDGALTLTPLDAAAFVRFAPPPGPRAAALDAVTKRAQTIAEGIVKRDYHAVQEALDNKPPLAQVERRQTELRQNLETKHGAMKSAAVIGSAVQRDVLATTIRFDFEHGTAYLQLLWDGPNALVGIRTMDDLPSSVYVPIAPAKFANYDFRSGETRTIEFVDGKLVL